MWNEKEPLALLNSMSEVLSLDNLEQIQEAIDKDKSLNGKNIGDFCGDYAPFCKHCDKSVFSPCAVAYVRMKIAQEYPVEMKDIPSIGHDDPVTGWEIEFKERGIEAEKPAWVIEKELEAARAAEEVAPTPDEGTEVAVEETATEEAVEEKLEEATVEEGASENSEEKVESQTTKEESRSEASEEVEEPVEEIEGAEITTEEVVEQVEAEDIAVEEEQIEIVEEAQPETTEETAELTLQPKQEKSAVHKIRIGLGRKKK